MGGHHNGYSAGSRESLILISILMEVFAMLAKILGNVRFYLKYIRMRAVGTEGFLHPVRELLNVAVKRRGRIYQQPRSGYFDIRLLK